MASYTQRDNKLWQAKVRRKDKPALSQGGFATKALAQAWAEPIEQSIRDGKFVDPTKAQKLTVVNLKQWYVDKFLHLRRAGNTDEIRLNNLIAYLGESRTVSGCAPEDFVAYAQTRINVDGVKPGTARRELDTARDLWNKGRIYRQIDFVENPVTDACKMISAERLIPPAAERDRRLKPGEYEALMGVVHEKPTDINDVIDFALVAPMREGEIAAMTDDRLEAFTNNTGEEYGLYHIAESKTDHMTGKQGRVMPLVPEAMRIIRKVQARRDAKLVAKYGANVVPLSATPRKIWAFKNAHAISKAFTRKVKKAGIINLHFHDLRHEGASRLHDDGKDVLKIMAFTGHTDLDSVKRYTHPSLAKLAKG